MSGKKRRKFKTEVQQLLDLVVHSLYSNTDIFLRELISNSSDAIDLARFESLSDESVLEDDPDWKIKIHVDKEAGTLTVSDNGVGMSAEEVDKNIGTIASSGTKRILQQLKENKTKVPPELIGQFGVGFYSAFMVSDKVILRTRRAGDHDAGIEWRSTGSGSYSVEQITKEKRGTDVILLLAEDMEEYLEEWKIRKIVKQFSDFVEHPVTMDVTREEVSRDEDGKPIEGAEKEVTVTEETLNSRKAIWQRSKDEIEDDEYNDFYKHISHDFQDPSRVIHWNVEGMTAFRALLYIPAKSQWSMFMPQERDKGIHLYVKRVFITDNCEELTPQYLRFVRGVVDSSDLPLNVSREILQKHALITRIRKNLQKKVLDTLSEMQEKDRDGYVSFWQEFGAILKEGIHTDIANREKLQELLIFQSSGTDAGAYVTIKEYVSRMPEGQEEIYYITGDDREFLEKSPHLEVFEKKGYEVLFMTDPIDEWVVQSMNSYDDKPLRSVAQGNVDLPSDEDADQEKKSEEDEKKYGELIGSVKEILGERVKDVRLSNRLTESACCLVADEAGMGIQMEKIMKAMNQDVPQARRILELNPEHPIVGTMKALREEDSNHPKLTEYSELLYDQALLTASLPIEDTVQFARRISELMASECKNLIDRSEEENIGNQSTDPK